MAFNTLTSLVVEITAKDSKLRGALNRAQRNIKSFGKSSLKALKVIGIGVAGLAAAFGGLVFGLKSITDGMDNIAKNASKLGIGINALQKLEFQASLAGVSTQELTKGLQQMLRQVSDAATGTGEAVDALKELGLSAKSLTQLAPEKQLEEIGKAMTGIGNSGARVRLAMDIFGRAGAGFINLFNQNLSETGKEFERLGIAISDVEAKAAEDFTDAFFKMQAIAKGFFQQLAGQIAPTFTALIDRILKVVKEMGGMRTIAEEAATALKDGFNDLLPILNVVWGVLKGIVATIKVISSTAGTLGEVGKGIGSAVSQLGRFAPGQRQLLQTPTRGQNPNIAVQSSFASGSSQFGRDSLRSPSSGRVTVHITSDNDAVIKRVEQSQSLKDVIVTEVDRTTKSAARQVAR